MTTTRAAFYARVSGEQRAAAHTIESQIAALSERAKSDERVCPVPGARELGLCDGLGRRPRFSSAVSQRAGISFYCGHNVLQHLQAVHALQRLPVPGPEGRPQLFFTQRCERGLQAPKSRFSGLHLGQYFPQNLHVANVTGAPNTGRGFQQATIHAVPQDFLSRFDLPDQDLSLAG